MNLKGDEDIISFIDIILKIVLIFIIVLSLLYITYNGYKWQQQEYENNPCFMANVIENLSENCHSVDRVQPHMIGKIWYYRHYIVIECQKYTQCRNGTLIKIN
jgi:hypothetical protein